MFKTFVFASVLTITCCIGLGQTREPRFNLISSVEGITPGKINCITRDREGVMWFTEQSNKCILRYDGTHMRRYLNNPKDTNSLGATGYPECIVNDSSGIIWIGFYDGGGLDRLDPATGNFTHYRHQANDAGSLANDTVSALLVDHLGNLWVGTDRGLDLLDQKTGKFKHHSHNPADTTSLSCNRVRALYEDHEGIIWVGTGFVFNPVSTEGGLNRLNRNNGTFSHYLHDPKNPRSLINDKVRAIFEDSRGTFWVGTSGDGLHTMDRKTGLFERHGYNPSDPSQLSRPEFKGGYDHITFITEDPEGAIWIGTFLNGLNRYDPVTKKVTHFGANADKTSGFKDDNPWCAYVSKDGLFLIATQVPDLYRVNLFNNIIPNFSLNHAAVNNFYEESPSVQWFGTDSGLVRKNLTNGTMQVFKNETHSSLGNITNNAVISITKDPQGSLWLGTSGGLNHFNPVTGVFTRFQHDPDKEAGIGGSYITSTHMDQESNLWVGMFNNGLDRMDAKTGLLTHFIHNPSDTNSISNNNVVLIFENEPGDLWTGNWNNGGLNRLNAQTGHFKHYLLQNNITSLLKDGGGTTWAGTQNGLYRYDRNTDEFYKMNEESTGLNISDVNSFVTDDQNNLWIGSSNGIYRFNPKKKESIFYGKESGIQAQYLMYGSAYKMRDGQIFFGNVDGYYSFYPGKLKNSPLVPKIQLTNFWINNQEIKSGRNGVLEAPLSETKEVRLHYNQNVFSFSFNAMDYANADDKQILYKLDGYNKEWRQQGSEPRAYYFNVPPGTYTLRLKAVNTNNGIWQEKDISIIISPPWWKTWWAYCIYVILFIVLAISIDRFQKVRILRAERERTRDREMAQAREIEKAYNELKLTQAQLIQSEKMASLGELTAGIAHEIQNPLNFVNNFSDINKELAGELQQELKSGRIEEAIAISNDLISNEEKINHHGKRADAIVKGMLQHTRSHTSTKESTNINALADEYLRLSYHGLRARDKSFNATMTTDFDPAIGNINIIPQDIGRVLLNLNNNAFYAVSEKKKKQPGNYEPTVSVSTRKVNGKVEIRVKDNGNGIPQKVIDKIFQPFFTTKPAGQGTGLGLSISYDIIKAHGGELKVESKEWEGTEFVIQLPVA
ncbi:MAG TPA: two-component regulator propeller domain-containing protein [Puia sp.]|nr:two-component regulator propeller domain-containing protein [Puia sp.]